jgi:hypothetical protein
MNFLLALLLVGGQVSGRADVGRGHQVVPANTTVGSIVAVGGNLDVYGTVHGNAAAVRGDVIVHRGGRVTGKAVAVMGKVRNAGGSIGGQVKQYAQSDVRGHVSRRSYSAHYNPWRSLSLTVGWLILVMIVGFGVISLAGDKVEIVVNTIRDGVGKSVGSGLLGFLAILPGAVGVALLLAVTLVGILLIPLGLAFYMLMLVGIAMFGFIAVLLLTGAAITGGKSRDDTPRGAMLRAFATGAIAYLGLWVVAAAFSWMPLVGALLRSFAAGASFIAMTAGFGAVLRSYWRGDFSKRAATG